jgi:DNA-binding protein YbaB
MVAMERPERPDLSAMTSAIEDLRRSLDNAKQTQRKMFQVTGTAWSPDRMIKAVVGPRGQLIDLEIDPRVYRQPNSKALAASILATVRAAVDLAIEQTQQILDDNLPSDLRGTKVGNFDTRRLMRSHDADLKAQAEEPDDD